MRSSFKQLCWIVLRTCVILLLVLSMPGPGTAQIPNPSPSPTPIPEPVPVVVDGQEVFRVTTADNFTAEQRADWINQHLAEIIQTQDKPTVEVVEQNGLPVLVANDRYLITVTNTDQTGDRDLQTQAHYWQSKIQAALNQAYAERQPQYLRHALLESSFVITLGLILAHLLNRLCQDWLQRSLLDWLGNKGIIEDDDVARQDINRWFGVLTHLLQVVILLGIILYTSNLFPITRQASYQVIQILRVSLTAPLFNVADHRYAITDLLVLVLLFWVILLGSSTVTRLLKSQVLSLTRMNRGTQDVVATISRYFLIFFGTIALLQAWGLDLSSLAILGGALGVGIGFGLQDIARDFSSGLILLFERSVQAGDFIEVDNYNGTVERVGARSILLRTLDSVSIIVPNSKFIRDNVINWSHENPLSRLRLSAPVAYGSDVQLVRSCLLKAAQDHPQVMDSPKPRVFFLGFGDNALNFELLIWIEDPSQQLPVTSELYFRIEDLFRHHRINVPFPQRDLHLRSGFLPVQLSPHLERALLRWMDQQGIETQTPDPQDQDPTEHPPQGSKSQTQKPQDLTPNPQNPGHPLT